MDNDVIQQPVPIVRKGRRGLARKQTGPAVTQTRTCSTSHKSAVYSSCVSRRYQNMLGGISTCDTTEEIIADTSATENIHKEEVLCDEAKKIEELEEQLSEPDLYNNDDLIEIDNDGKTIIPVLGSLRSPTPPPDSQGPSYQKKRRLNKKLQTALNTLNKAKDDLNRTPSTPFSKSRRKKGKSNKVVDADVVLLAENTPTKTDMEIKVRYLSSIHRLRLKMMEPFHNLLTQLSRETGHQMHHLSLFLHDQTLPLSQTPTDVGLTVADIIECHCIKDGKSGSGNEAICLLIQCSNSKRKTEIKTTKRQPFKEVLEKYALQVGIDASAFHFCFDGDDVGPTDTPLALEMDEGDILDLMPVSTQESRSQRSAWSNSVISLI